MAESQPRALGGQLIQCKASPRPQKHFQRNQISYATPRFPDVFILFNIQFKCLKRVNSILGFFKLGLYSLPFTVNGLKAVLNTSQEGYIYKELLKSFCYIKVLQVLKTISNYPGNINIKSIKEADKHFTKIYQQGVIYIIVTHSKRSRWGNQNL